jgi:predicted dehydrogenase
MKKLKVILIGAGNRGTGYTDIMSKHRDKFEVVAVAEPIQSRREHIKNVHNIPEHMCFEDYAPLLEKGKIADVAVIATMDRMHLEPAMKAINLKYDLLLEKPITPTPKECIELTKAAKKKGVKVVICTVLRYTLVFNTLKEIIDSGRIGKVMAVNHEENVGNIHQSHSFVRGNWGNEGRSSNMLLQKTCHDFDILQWLLGKKCKKVQSFGSLSYFKRENAPDGSPEYCIEGCPHERTCRFSAVKLYLENKGETANWFRTTCTRLDKPTDDDVRLAITETQYGKCVYKCDNDVVDHQTVNMLFEDDIAVTFSMNAFNKGGRHIHIYGTEGEVIAAIEGNKPITIYDFDTGATSEIDYKGVDGITGGHGGGDEGIIETLYDYLTGKYKGKSVPTIEESCYNHLITFAAEESRLSGKIVDVDEYIASI